MDLDHLSALSLRQQDHFFVPIRPFPHGTPVLSPTHRVIYVPLARNQTWRGTIPQKKKKFKILLRSVYLLRATLPTPNVLVKISFRAQCHSVLPSLPQAFPELRSARSLPQMIAQYHHSSPTRLGLSQREGSTR
jgi:hypothetical protein